MRNDLPIDDADRQLARQFLDTVRLDAGPCPEAIELAAHAEGRLSEVEAERVEAHLAACRQCLDALLEVRALHSAPAETPPASVASAQALVAGRARSSAWRAVAGWAAAAAAALAVGAAGLHAGASMREARRQTDDQLVAEVTFGLMADAPRGDLLEGFLAAARRADVD